MSFRQTLGELLSGLREAWKDMGGTLDQVRRTMPSPPVDEKDKFATPPNKLEPPHS